MRMEISQEIKKEPKVVYNLSREVVIARGFTVICWISKLSFLRLPSNNRITTHHGRFLEDSPAPGECSEQIVSAREVEIWKCN